MLIKPRYVSMLKMISPGGKSNGIVFVPARQGFVPSSSVAATASGGPPVELFFDLQELRVRSCVHAKRVFWLACGVVYRRFWRFLWRFGVVAVLLLCSPCKMRYSSVPIDSSCLAVNPISARLCLSSSQGIRANGERRAASGSSPQAASFFVSTLRLS